MLKEGGGRLNDWSMQLCLIQGKYTLIHSRCASPYVSLSHTYTHSLESKRSGCWRKGTTTAFQKNAEWNPDCCVGYKHAQNWPKYAVKQTNARKMKYNTVTNKQHTPAPILKAPSSILEQNIKHSCFVQLAEFSSWIIFIFKQNRALKFAGFRWEERHEFYSTMKHMELTEIGGNWIAESDMSKKNSNCSTKRNLLCVGKREHLSWKAKRNCRIVQGWQTLQTVIADMEY